MSVLVLGFSHHTADLALLERLAVPSETTGKVLRALVALDHVLEAAVLSTCNRVEFYVHLARFHPGYDELVAWLQERAGDRADDVATSQYAHVDDAAALHLFRVASGMDSMVIGEQQIALQVKQAMEDARHEGSARRMLQRLFRQAIRVSRRVRRETAILDGASSMVDVGLAAALDDRSDDHPGTTLIVGAGKIGALTAEQLTARGHDVVVWNRSDDKAGRLADRVGARTVADLADGLALASFVVTTTGAPEPVITPALLGDRGPMPVVLLDLAMPRNVDPACAAMDGVTVVDIAAVREVAMAGHVGDDVMPEAAAIVEDEAARFQAWLSAMEVEPTVRSLRATAERIRQEELLRLAGRLASFDAEQQATIEALTKGIVNTLLHEPTIRLKELADAGGADIAVEALRELFDLDESE